MYSEKRRRRKKTETVCVCVCAGVIDETHIETETKLIKYLPPTTEDKRNR
jgi:hypothetical protein